MQISATYYGANGWLIQLGSIRILIDPWLNGQLSFPPGDWLIKGELNKEVTPPPNITYLLLTQGQADHSHTPTLSKLDKSITVIASNAASKVVRKLGYKRIIPLTPGESFKNDVLTIEATAGAPVPNIENGYIIDHPCGSIYIEPHGFLDVKVKARNIDLVITPVIDFALPIAGKFIKGKSILPKLITLFKPKTLFSSTTGGDIRFTGILNKFISVEGTTDDESIFINTSTKYINPKPYYKYLLTDDN
tara:strand:- start:472 stop:1215 length:744 start_codon:yes stop_codon:yes gene_type:complete